MRFHCAPWGNIGVVALQKHIFCGTDFGSTIALDLQHKLKTFLPYILLKNKWQCDLLLEIVALSCSSEVLFVKFPWFLAFFVGLFFGLYIFMRDRVAALENIRLVVDLIGCT